MKKEKFKKDNTEKELEIKLFGGKKAYITSKMIVIDDGKYTITIFPSDLEDMTHYINSLNQN